MDEKNEIRSEVIEDLLVEYSGHPLDLNALSNYDRAAMAYFTDSRVARQPRLHITLSLEITEAHRAFADRAGRYLHRLPHLGPPCDDKEAPLSVMAAYRWGMVRI